jgi:hypothetical protein
MANVTAFFQGLRLGATEPSAAAALWLLVTAAGLLLALFLGVDEDLVRDHGMDVLLDDANDFDAYASFRALELKVHDVGSPLVIITGGSTTRDAIFTELLSADYANRATGPVAVFKLTTSRQTLLDSVAMLDMIPAGASGAAIIGVTPSMFAAFPMATSIPPPPNIDSARYAFRSQAFDDELGRLGFEARPRYGHYLLDNAPFFLARLDAIAANLLRGAPVYEERRIRPSQRVRPELWDFRGGRVAQRLTDYGVGVDAGLVTLDRALQRLAARTAVTPVLVEAPVNPRFLREFGQTARFASHRSRLRAFAEERSLVYLELNALAGLEEPLFYDWAHIVDGQAVRRCTTVIADATVPLLKGRNI